MRGLLSDNSLILNFCQLGTASVKLAILAFMMSSALHAEEAPQPTIASQSPSSPHASVEVETLRPVAVGQKIFADGAFKPEIASGSPNSLPIMDPAIQKAQFVSSKDGIAADADQAPACLRCQPKFVASDHIRIVLPNAVPANSVSLFGSSIRYTALPATLIWQPPLASQQEPRMWVRSSNANGESTIDTAIGTTRGLMNLLLDEERELAIQLDFFAVVFTRFNERRLLTAVDYRVGAPITAAWRDWRFKFGFEHSSSHIGDEYAAVTGKQQMVHVRDELVFGVARNLTQRWKVYGQFAYAVNTSELIGDQRDRFNLGTEWGLRQATDWRGSPFLAYDLTFRADQSHHPNHTLQLGWQIIDPISERRLRAFLELYRGLSPFGQFYRDHESWLGVVVSFDF